MEFIKSTSSQFCTNSCDATINSNSYRRTNFIRIVHHRSKLVDLEVFPVSCNTFLSVENWAFRIQLYHHSNNSHWNGKEDK